MRRRGVTLTECLLVTTTVGVCFALLVPLISSTWQMAHLTRCSYNLHTIYQAEILWRAERGSSCFAQGSNWQSQLMPYVEDCESVFECPEAGAPRPSAGVTTADIAFEVYSDRSFSRRLLTIWLDSPWARKTQAGPDAYLYEIEIPYTGVEYNDVRCTVWFEGGFPSRLRIEKPGSHVWGVDLVVNGEVLLHDVDGHIGQEIELPNSGVYIGLCHYGLSKGTYETDGQPVSVIDPKWILILDYPKAIADYNQFGDDDDQWDKYFILDEREWMDAYGAELREGESWRDYQALRHFGMANALFCDGHVALLRPEDLWETTPLWSSLSSLLATSVPPDTLVPQNAAISQDVFPLTVTANSSQPLPQDMARPRGQRLSGPSDATSGRGALAPGDVTVDDFGKPRWVANNPSPGLAVTFYWNCTGEADVYLNGKPLRYYGIGFRTREAPPSRVFSARRMVRNGDVITVGARRGELCGFLLVAVDDDGKVVWKTDATNWKAYFPQDEKVWWSSEVAMNSERRPVKIQSDPWPPQTRIRRRFGDTAESIWYERDQFVFLVSAIQSKALMGRGHPEHAADR